jgi:hypothetical protein
MGWDLTAVLKPLRKPCFVEGFVEVEFDTKQLGNVTIPVHGLVRK